MMSDATPARKPDEGPNPPLEYKEFVSNKVARSSILSGGGVGNEEVRIRFAKRRAEVFDERD